MPQNLVFTKIQFTLRLAISYYFYSEDHDHVDNRTRDGKEVDFVIESPQGSLVGIDVKNTENIAERDLSGLKKLRAIAKKDLVCGIVLCNTPRPLPFGDNIFLVPFSALWS